jgi:uncharacterized damage-inducible protein DinB
MKNVDKMGTIAYGGFAMNKQDLLTLYDYTYWARDKIMTAADKVTPAQFSEPVTYSHGSLQGILVHMVGVEWLWRSRAQEGVSPKELLEIRDFPTVDSVWAYMIGEQHSMLKYLNELDDEKLNSRVSYQRMGGEPQTSMLWQILMHVVNHGTQHRSEAAWILTSYSHSPGDLDFIFYTRALDAGKI